MPFLFILLLVLVFPAAEVYSMVRVFQAIGWWVLPGLALAALVGWMLIQEEKLAVFGRLFSALQSGRPLSLALLDSLRTLIAGALLMFPGFISDVIALTLLVWPRKRPPEPPSRQGEEAIEGEFRREREVRKRLDP